MPRFLLLLVPVLAVAGAGVGILARHADPPPVVETPEPSAVATAPAFVVVDVAGAVAHPGVVRLPAGSRVIDALLAAGGMTGDADLYAVNKAALLRDGMRVYVPKPGEVVPAGSVGTQSETKIDINHASEPELNTLPGIGPSTAAKIVRSRQQRPFARIEELQTRGLVTPRVYADIKDLVSTR
ncbi:MAG: helix-hairpin-helix domain-containing protein [Chloroflexota bacterium]|nr:helix-hairpin-helix domain-containing protein [Chloroflexota bacterium]